MIIPELVDGCHLKCALCWNRKRTGSFRQMSLQTVEKVLKRYGHLRKQTITWFNWGEPLLYKEFVTFANMVEGTRSIISSNFSLHVSNAYFESLQKFESFIISLSGMTPEVYQIYNRGGNFDLVMSNIKRASEQKYRKVTLRWQGHKYNVFQLEQARAFAKEMGFIFEPIGLNCEVEELAEGFEHELLQSPKFRGNSRGKECRLLGWVPIDVDGNYLLCCTSHNVKIGLTIDDDVNFEDLKEAKMKMELCQSCRENQYWRMF